MDESNGHDLGAFQFIEHRQEEVIEALSRGEIQDVRVSQDWPVDDIVSFGLKEGWLKKGLQSFPDPRKWFEIPIEVLLLPQILQRLNDEHSLLLAPYMLNSAELISQLGFNVSVLQDGFNDRAIYERKAPFHGDTLRQILLSCRGASLIDWYNTSWLPIWREHSPGRTKTYLMDGTQIEVPAHNYLEYDGAGKVENKDGTYSYGYKVVWLREVIDKKGIIVALKVGPIQRHDIELGRELIDSFEFEEGSVLIMDRGFIDGQWITDLKTSKRVDVVIPLKRNMDVVRSVVSFAQNRPERWKPHPTREEQKIFEVHGETELFWSECLVLQSGVLCRFTKNDGVETEVLFVSTLEKLSGKQLLGRYDLRAEIEEDHRQLKCYQGLEKLPSKKFVQVIFRILMGLIGYNMMNLFLNSEKCETFEEFSLKSLRQKRPQKKNPDIIIYTKWSFAILRQFQFFQKILNLETGIQKTLSKLFENLDLSPAPL